MKRDASDMCDDIHHLRQKRQRLLQKLKKVEEALLKHETAEKEMRASPQSLCCDETIDVKQLFEPSNTSKSPDTDTDEPDNAEENSYQAMPYHGYDPEENVCYMCGDGCSALSQACGRCMRRL